MTEYRTCIGTNSCGRSIPVAIFDLPSAHAPGCRRRLSMLAKASAAKRRGKAERAAARAAERAARRAQA